MRERSRSSASCVRAYGVRRPLVVTDDGVVAAGLAARALERLSDPVLFAEVRANPDIALVDRAAALYAEERCDGLVAVGGGSPMDTAKAVGVVVRHGGSIAQYEWGHDEITQRIPPLVTVPTTAGTGSEVTLWAVITDPGRRIKFNVGGTPLIAPHAALVDPELMLALPPAVTAATGMDALAHAVECYTCDYHQPFTDAVALHAIELVAAWLVPAVEDGHEPGGAHRHGPRRHPGGHVLRHRERRRRPRHEPVGGRRARLLARRPDRPPAGPGVRLQRAGGAAALRARGAGAGRACRRPDPLEAAVAGVEAIHTLTERVGIPTMAALGFREEEIPLLARIAFEDPQTMGNPREVGVAEYEQIYRDAFARPRAR